MCPPLAGSYFHLNEQTCHPWLTISEDGLTVVRSERKTSAGELPASNTRFTRYFINRSLEHSVNLPSNAVIQVKLDYDKQMQP